MGSIERINRDKPERKEFEGEKGIFYFSLFMGDLPTFYSVLGFAEHAEADARPGRYKHLYLYHLPNPETHRIERPQRNRKTQAMPEGT